MEKSECFQKTKILLKENILKTLIKPLSVQFWNIHQKLGITVGKLMLIYWKKFKLKQRVYMVTGIPCYAGLNSIFM